MRKPRTHFEQVPLAVIKEIVEENMAPKTRGGGDPSAKKKKVKKGLLAHQKPSKAIPRSNFKMELSE
jgi:hypothetical protein